MHEYLVEQPRDLGQVQADELRVKKQGGIVWMALAMMVKTRLWLGGEVSEQRDMALIRRLVERVKRCAARRPLLVCTDGWCPTSEPFGSLSRSHTHGQRWATAAAPLAQRPDRPRGRSATSGAVSSRPTAALSTARPPRRDAQTALAGQWRHQYGIHRAAERNVPGTPRAAGTSVPGAGTPDPDTARGHVLGGHGL